MTGLSNRLSVYFLSVIIIGMAILQPATAAMITTHQMLSNQSTPPLAPAQDFGQLQQNVVTLLVDNGVSAADAVHRVNALTHQELAMLQSRIDDLPAGQGGLALVGAVFLVLLLLELVGVINIFNKL